MLRNPKFVVLVSGGVGILAGVVLMAAYSAWWANHLPSVIGVRAQESSDLNAGQLASFCRRSAELIPSVYCDGFIGGAIGSRTAISLCLPDGWDTGKARKLFLAWSDRHSERWSNPAASEVIQAHAVFNCRTAGHGI